MREGWDGHRAVSQSTELALLDHQGHAWPLCICDFPNMENIGQDSTSWKSEVTTKCPGCGGEGDSAER